MKGSKRRSQRIKERQSSTGKTANHRGHEGTQRKSPLKTVHSLLERLARAKAEHIRDLRTVVDQGNVREERLAKLVEELVDAKLYRPAVTPARAPAPHEPAIAPEAMQDVTSFDEGEDQARIEEEAELGKDLQDEFEQISQEHEKWRAEQGLKPEPSVAS